jgi:hypothetical protein
MYLASMPCCDCTTSQYQHGCDTFLVVVQELQHHGVKYRELNLQDKNGKYSNEYVSFGWDHKPLPVVGKTRLQLIAEYVEEYLGALFSHTGDAWGMYVFFHPPFFLKEEGTSFWGPHVLFLLVRRPSLSLCTALWICMKAMSWSHS